MVGSNKFGGVWIVEHFRAWDSLTNLDKKQNNYHLTFYYPSKNIKGAFDPYNHIYTSSDVKEIIEFARQRGIRVVSEFDSPGHTLSWSKELLTPCYKDSKPDGSFGPMDPTNNATYAFLKSFIKELTNVFPDKYIHLGGDEFHVFILKDKQPKYFRFYEKDEIRR